MLQVRGLEVHYGGILALHGVDVSVNQGEIVTLIGANGAGKTTLLRAISGLQPRSAGSIRFQDKEIARWPADRIVQVGIGHSPEGRRVFAPMTVHENLELGAYTRHDRKGIASDFDRMTALFPRLKERLKQAAGTLSGGEQQMLAMARALMGRPKLLMLDEPSLGLAPVLVQEIFRIIQEINAQGTTVLLVEQNAHQALTVANRGYVLQTGQVLLEDTGANLLNSELVREAYLG
ncbi:MAG TPA: ABC transporter ATP-binding protein [Armatimonadota bacterium]